MFLNIKRNFQQKKIQEIFNNKISRNFQQKIKILRFSKKNEIMKKNLEYSNIIN